MVACLVAAPAGELGALYPIVLQPICVQCHGKDSEVAAEVRTQLARDYPIAACGRTKGARRRFAPPRESRKLLCFWGLPEPLVDDERTVMTSDPSCRMHAACEEPRLLQPKDLATGYAPGDVRGYFWVEVPRSK